ncbi:SprT-like family [Salmonella enterica subsp. indica]|uniref:SprT-like family n=1 Tax=Salmonella enterica subsp. indica TaxID=59207 RepID=A0A379YSH1_SALER|nr:SprT-like family [Salmonella enterica subsp. indica]
MLNPTADTYNELQIAFEHFNKELFNGEIPYCLITLQREKKTYGYFSSKRFVHRTEKTATDEIALNPSYFAVIPEIEIMQTLVHEMAHAWQFHYGKPGRRGYHNKEWG